MLPVNSSARHTPGHRHSGPFRNRRHRAGHAERRDAARPHAGGCASRIADPASGTCRAAGHWLRAGLVGRAGARGAGARIELPTSWPSTVSGWPRGVPAEGELTRDAAVAVIGANIARELLPRARCDRREHAHRRATVPRHRHPRRRGPHDRARFAGAGGHSGQCRAGTVQHRVAVPAADAGAQP